MKNVLLIFLFLTFSSGTKKISDFSKKEKYNSSVWLPQDDASGLNIERMHLYVGKYNQIALSVQDKELIKIWTDNGIILREGNYDYIIPNITGQVNIFTKEKKFRDGKYDTITLKNTFIVLPVPDLVVKIKKDNLKKDSTLEYILINRKDSSKADKRYFVGRYWDIYIYDQKDSLIGLSDMNYKLKFDLKHVMNKIKQGYKLKFDIPVRDKKTDLLSWYPVKYIVR